MHSFFRQNVSLFIFITIVSFIVLSNANPVRALTPSQSKNFFPIGFFVDSNYYTNSTIAEIQPFGFNTMFLSNGDVDSIQSRLTFADQSNFNIIVSPSDLFKNNLWYGSNKPATLEEALKVAQPLVDKINPHKSVIAYSATDDINDPPKVTAMMQAFRQLDSTRDITGLATPYNGNQTVWYLPNFPVMFAGEKCSLYRNDRGANDYVDQVRMNRNYTPPAVPYWFGVQAHGSSISGSDPYVGLRIPTVEELRLQQWLALGEGAKGLFWFTYYTTYATPSLTYKGIKDTPEFYTEVKDFVKKISPWTQTLLTSEKVEDMFTVTAPAQTYTSTLKQGSTYYTFAVNHSCSSQTVTVTSNYFTGKLKDMETGQIYPLGSSFNLRGGDGKFFQLVESLPKNYTRLLAPNILLNGSFETLDTTGSYALNWGKRTESTIDASTAFSGTNSIRIDGGTGANYSSQSLLLKPNTRYRVSFWTKMSNNTAANTNSVIGVRYAQLSVSSKTMGGVNGGKTANWTKRLVFFTTPPDYQSGRFDITWNQIPQGEKAWIDDIIVCEGRDPCQGEQDPIFYNQATGTPTLGVVTGDANSDGKVDGIDYIAWLNHYGITTANVQRDGDFNTDGKVDGIDYVLWLANYK